jgi:hypothetical protein
MRFEAATLLGRFGFDERSIALAIAQRLNDGSAVYIEFVRGSIDVPIVRPHIGDELGGGLSPAFERKLTSPRMRHANEEIVGRVRPQSAR